MFHTKLLRHKLLQIVAGRYYKSWQLLILQIVAARLLQIVAARLLQIVAGITNRGKIITNRVRYYKSWQLLHNGA